MIRLLLLVLLTAAPVHAFAQDSDPAERLGRSVVKISTRNASVSQFAEGSGFFVDAAHVVTNWHVMQDVVEARVIFVDGTYHDVTEVIAGDPTWDLMLLKVDVPAGEARPLPLAAEVAAGDQTVYLATQGLLEEEYEREEGEARSFHLREGRGQLENFEEFELLRTDAEMISGNSGSPVLDAEQQRVVGVAAMIQEGSDGTVLTSYAIPAPRVTALLESLGEEGTPLVRWQRERMGSPEYYVDLMQVLVNSGRTPMAAKIFDQYRGKQEDESAISREAWCLGGLTNMALAAGREGEAWTDTMTKARELYQRAIDTAPRTSFDCIVKSNCTYALGYIAWCFSDYGEAKRWLRYTLELDPRDPDTVQVLSMVFAEQRKWKKADKWRRRLIELVGEQSALVPELDEWHAQCRAEQAEEDEDEGGR